MPFLSADLELDVVVRADLGPDRAHDVEREASAVLERAAVVVVAVVDARGEKLRDQVAVAPVHLDPVRAGFAGAVGSPTEVADDLTDLLHRHPLAGEAVQGLSLPRRAQALRVLDPADVALPSRVRDLDDVAAVVLVNSGYELAPEGDAVVPVDVGVARDDQSPRMDG